MQQNHAWNKISSRESDVEVVNGEATNGQDMHANGNLYHQNLLEYNFNGNPDDFRNGNNRP